MLVYVVRLCQLLLRRGDGDAFLQGLRIVIVELCCGGPCNVRLPFAAFICCGLYHFKEVS